MARDQIDSVGVFFILAGRDFDPAECTRAIGLEPTKVWQQRHAHLQARRDLDNVNWCVGFEQKSYDAISEAVDEVLDQIWPYREKIITYAELNALTIAVSCNVRIHQNAPEFVLTASTIQRLAELKAEFGMDILDYRDDEETKSSASA